MEALDTDLGQHLKTQVNPVNAKVRFGHCCRLKIGEQAQNFSVSLLAHSLYNKQLMICARNLFQHQNANAIQ